VIWDWRPRDHSSGLRGFNSTVKSMGISIGFQIVQRMHATSSNGMLPVCPFSSME